MNIRIHSKECEEGKPCRRCYIRIWDKKRRDRTRKHQFVARVECRKPQQTEEWVKDQQLKGRLNYLEDYSVRKAEMLAKNAEYRRANGARFNAYSAKHKAAKRQQVPLWADLEKIAAIYEGCPAGMEVDHIVPLQGKNVSGLHVHYNLQYLTVSENRSKGNRLKEGYPYC